MRLALVILTLLCTSVPAWAQLTNDELLCRYRGQHVGAVIEQRSLGWTLSDTLLEGEAQFAARGMAQAWRTNYHDLTRMAYGLSDLTPEQARRLVEGVCLEFRADEARRQVQRPKKARPKTTLTHDPRQY